MTLTVERVQLGELKLHPENPNEGDVDGLADSLKRYGQWRPAVVQRSTGHVLIGNTMVRAAQRLHWPAVDVHYRDCDDAEARRILLRDNKARDRARYDDRALADLLAELDDLDGSGFELPEVEDLLARLDAAPLPDTPGRPAPQEPTVLVTGSTPAPSRPVPPGPEYREEFAEQATRFLALPYPLAQHAWVEEKLSKLAADNGYDGHPETVLRLLAERVNEIPPAAA